MEQRSWWSIGPDRKPITPLFQHSITPFWERFASHHRIRQVVSVQRLLMADKNHLILTAVGPDQIGLVEKISAFVSQHGCNIEDSKMAVFCGEFAVIVLISGDATGLSAISKNYRDIETETGL